MKVAPVGPCILLFVETMWTGRWVLGRETVFEHGSSHLFLLLELEQLPEHEARINKDGRREDASTRKEK